MTEEKPDLLPCPFCGSHAKITETQFQIGCSNWQSCAVRPRVQSNDLGTAISKWHDRAPQVTVSEGVDEETGEVLQGD